MSFRTLGIIELVRAVVLFLVQEILLALIFAGLGIFMIFGLKQQPKKQTSSGNRHTATVNAPVTRQQSQHQKPVNAVRNTHTPASIPDAYAYQGNVDQYFTNLLRTNFPDYQTEQNVTLDALSVGVSTAAGWICSCGNRNTGKFCAECGQPKPVDNKWTCSCGQRNTSKFCGNCGMPKPATQATMNIPNNAATLNFLLRQGGTPKLGIILCHKDAWNTEQITNTMEACKKANIPCLRFMREFRNDPAYVTQRIRNTLL